MLFLVAPAAAATAVAVVAVVVQVFVVVIAAAAAGAGAGAAGVGVGVGAAAVVVVVAVILQVLRLVLPVAAAAAELQQSPLQPTQRLSQLWHSDIQPANRKGSPLCWQHAGCKWELKFGATNPHTSVISHKRCPHMHRIHTGDVEHRHKSQN